MTKHFKLHNANELANNKLIDMVNCPNHFELMDIAANMLGRVYGKYSYEKLDTLTAILYWLELNGNCSRVADIYKNNSMTYSVNCGKWWITKKYIYDTKEMIKYPNRING